MSIAEDNRIERAKLILSRPNAVKEITGELFLVQSQTGFGSYKVEWDGKQWICECPDFQERGHIRPCKHVLALEFYIDKKFLLVDKEELEPTRITYPQDWKNYNKAQASEIELFDQFLFQLLSSIKEPKQKRGRPRHNLKDLIFCCVMKTYSQLSSRRSQCLYQQAMQQNLIDKNVHYNALSRTLLRKELTPLLYKLVRESALPIAGIEVDFAIDSSGFRCSTFGSYCEQKHGGRKRHNWLKAHICTGVYTNIITDIVITDEYVHDSPQLKKLVKNTSKNFDIRELSADMAYSSRKNYETIAGIGAEPYIPFKKNATGFDGGSWIWKQAYHYFQLNKEDFMDHYHKRSNAESTFAAIKRKFGESLKSKDRVAQENELLCKIIAYNITVLIREMIHFNCVSNFLPNYEQKESINHSSDKFYNHIGDL